jgi:serine protease Do
LAPTSFSDLAEKASPAVVNIQTEKTIKGGGPVFRHFFRGPRQKDPYNDYFNREFDNRQQPARKQQSLGSGFIIDTDGFIVTNNHVINNSDSIKVILKDGSEHSAKVIGVDKNTDLALIKIETDKKLPVLSLGNSDSVKVGQWVMAIGNPFGLDHTVTAGIVSAKGRALGAGPYDDFIQTDASINPGNSGGPLLSLDGKVVGINTAMIKNGQGIGFAIPANMADQIVNQLKMHGEVSRGWLGVSIQDLDDKLSEYYGLRNKKGVLITDVFENNPAAKAGIKTNDILTEIDGVSVKSSKDLIRQIGNTSPGDRIKIKLIRSGKAKTLTVTIAKREESQQVLAGNGFDSFGIKAAEKQFKAENRLRMPIKNGVVVIEIETGSNAFKAGLRTGDVILEINHQKIGSLKNYKKVTEKIKKGNDATFVIFRPNFGVRAVAITK